MTAEKKLSELANIVRGKSASVPEIILFLRALPRKVIDAEVDRWKAHGKKILSVVRWDDCGDGEWALCVSLGPFGREGEEAYIPFPWLWDDQPRLREAISIVRNMTVHHVQT